MPCGKNEKEAASHAKHFSAILLAGRRRQQHRHSQYDKWSGRTKTQRGGKHGGRKSEESLAKRMVRGFRAEAYGGSESQNGRGQSECHVIKRAQKQPAKREQE